MKYVFSLLISLFLSDLTQASCTVLDDKGNKIILVHPAQHVISLAPDLTEILFAIGAKDQIAGVIKGSDYPAAAKQLPIVASYNSVNLEKILMHHADLIIVWGEGQFVQTLKKLSIPIYVSDPKKITDIPNTMQRLGCLTGKEKNAGKAIQEFNEQYQKLEKTYSSQKKLSVFYQVWQQPLITVSKQSWINDVITM
jgi:iron complex transport system substrate-binding protein